MAIRKRRGRPANPEWLTTPQLCELLQISRQYCYKLRDDGTWRKDWHYKPLTRKGSSRAIYRWHRTRILADRVDAVGQSG